jgi:hypothetical protein
VATHVTFEKVSVLFNIAALHSKLAEIQDLSNDVGLRAAFTHFQVRKLDHLNPCLS